MAKKKRVVLSYAPNEKVVKALEFWGYLNKGTGKLNKNRNFSELMNRLLLSKLRKDANNDFELARTFAVWQINELRKDREDYCGDIDAQIGVLADEIRKINKQEELRLKKTRFKKKKEE